MHGIWSICQIVTCVKTMRIQMVVLANAEEQRGRLLAGVLLEHGAPAMEGGKPHWLRLQVRKDKAYIPKALIVDVRPLDIISFELHDGGDLADAAEWVVIDPYSLQINGQMDRDEIDFCCPCESLGHSIDEGAQQPWAQAFCSIFACNCAVVMARSASMGGKQRPQLRFGYDGSTMQLPLDDPQLLEAIEMMPDLLVGRPSLQLLLSSDSNVHGAKSKPRVLTVLY
jgi:hypothetical protein